MPPKEPCVFSYTLGTKCGRYRGYESPQRYWSGRLLCHPVPGWTLYRSPASVRRRHISPLRCYFCERNPWLSGCLLSVGCCTPRCPHPSSRPYSGNTTRCFIQRQNLFGDGHGDLFSFMDWFDATACDGKILRVLGLGRQKGSAEAHAVRRRCVTRYPGIVDLMVASYSAIPTRNCDLAGVRTCDGLSTFQVELDCAGAARPGSKQGSVKLRIAQAHRRVDGGGVFAICIQLANFCSVKALYRHNKPNLFRLIRCTGHQCPQELPYLIPFRS